jgi:hypothetical protein
MLEISFKDEVLENYQATLADFGEGGARKLLNMALNRIGKKAFTAVKRDLRDATGAAYDQITDAVSEVKSNPGTLTYMIHAKADYLNLRAFHPYSGARAFTAAPWNERHAFPATFQPGPPRGYDSSATVYHRTGQGRAIKPSYGPNIAKEMVKPAVETDFKRVIYEVMEEIPRLIKLRLEHQGPFSRIVEEN